MKQKMDQFEESLDCINIINSIAELKQKICQLEYKYKYSLAHNDISSNGRIDNRNQNSNEKQLLKNRSNSMIRSNIHSTKIKTSNSIAYKNVNNSINRSDQNL